ncbi:hypothetical protein BGZ83_007628 [Gryganskiella cystojenkinii]|nr:hypothetical protein BGZ83_007628 [Gryganskiella cystojenkinii]
MASNLPQYRLASINSTTTGYELLMFGQIPCPSIDTNCWHPDNTKNSPAHYKVPFGRNQIVSRLNWTSVLPQTLVPAVIAPYTPCSSLDLDLSSPVLEFYDAREGIFPAHDPRKAFIDVFAHADEVYLASYSQGLVRYNPTLGTCLLPKMGIHDNRRGATNEYRNRTLSAIVGLSLPTSYVYGGIDTSPNGTLSVSDELWQLGPYTNKWIKSTNTTQHQMPPSYSAVIFIERDRDLYLIGGCNTTATAFDPTDITGCQAMDTVYKTGVDDNLPAAAEVLSVRGWIPPITKSFCSTFIPELGLFVSGGYQAPTVTGGPPTINTASWLLTIHGDNGSDFFTWENVTIDHPKSLPSLPAVGHDCLFSAEQILFVGRKY